MDKELIKQLLKALKPQQTVPIVNGTTDSLPELPSLGIPQRESLPQEEAPTDFDPVSLDRRGLNLKSDLANILVNHKGVNLDSQYLDGNLGYDGSVGVNAGIPLENGNISAGYNSKDGNRNFNLNARKKMLGGDVGLDVTNDNGNKRYYLQYQRQF